MTRSAFVVSPATEAGLALSAFALADSRRFTGHRLVICPRETSAACAAAAASAASSLLDLHSLMFDVRTASALASGCTSWLVVADSLVLAGGGTLLPRVLVLPALLSKTSMPWELITSLYILAYHWLLDLWYLVTQLLKLSG